MKNRAKYLGASDDQVQWGNGDNPRRILEVGSFYEVDQIDVHSYHTKVKLVGIRGWFNSVYFKF